MLRQNALSSPFRSNAAKCALLSRFCPDSERTGHRSQFSASRSVGEEDHLGRSAPEEPLKPPTETSFGNTHANLIQMMKQIARVLIDPERSGPLQFFLAVAARKESDTQRSCPPRCQQIPDAVSDHETRIDWH